MEIILAYADDEFILVQMMQDFIKNLEQALLLNQPHTGGSTSGGATHVTSGATIFNKRVRLWPEFNSY